ncbi:FUSC family protein [Nonomuraea sp. NPDC049152]|uniref:FUSC family protein n=1 Tax=Nonomuraea sp. NPDC049152 TaxID=3154350 RepID=UPI0033EA9B04
MASASDPGLFRLRRALRVLTAVLLTQAVLLLAGLPSAAMVPGAIVAATAAFTVTDSSPRQKAITFLLLPVAAGLPVVIEAVQEPYPHIVDAAFLAVVFCGVYLRRFAPRGFAVGMVAFMTFFIVMLFHATTAQLPALLPAALIGVACAAFSHFVVVRERPERSLSLMIGAFRIQMVQVIDAVGRLIQGGRADARRERRLRGRMRRIHESALLIEEQLAKSVAQGSTGGRLHLIATELAVERLSMSASRAVAEGLPPRVRPRLRAELNVLRSLVSRAPHAAAVAHEEGILRRLADSAGLPDADSGPGLRGLHAAMREFAVTWIRARRAMASLGTPGDPVEEESAEHHQTAEQPPGERSEEEAEAAEPGPPAGLRLTTRQAIQATAAAALAITIGELVSPQRWYWAVVAAFLVFANTTSRGDILLGGFRRTLGTVLGMVAGIAVATVVAGNLPLTLLLLLGCVFCAYYLAPVSQSSMMFFITVMLALLYSLLGTFTPHLLELRLEETAIGIAAGALAAVLILPTHTSTTVRSDLAALLENMQQFVEHAMELLSTGQRYDLVSESRDIDRRLDTLHSSAAPLTHPITPFRTQRSDLDYLLNVLDSCAYYIRALAAQARPARMAGDERLASMGRRITANLDLLLAGVHGTDRPLESPSEGDMPTPCLVNHEDLHWLCARRASERVDTDWILCNVDRLDKSVAGLANPLWLSTRSAAARRAA